jgi:hypothetical protein
VAPASPRCWAVSSSDVAPVMVAIGAEYVLVGPGGERVVPASRFYHNDGINYLTSSPTRFSRRGFRRPTADAVYHKPGGGVLRLPGAGVAVGNGKGEGEGEGSGGGRGEDG